MTLPAGAPISQIALDGLSPRLDRRLRVAGGLFKIVQYLPSLPGLGDVAERLIALKRTAQFAAGVVVALQLDQGSGQTAADESLIPFE